MSEIDIKKNIYPNWVFVILVVAIFALVASIIMYSYIPNPKHLLSNSKIATHYPNISKTEMSEQFAGIINDNYQSLDRTITLFGVLIALIVVCVAIIIFVLQNNAEKKMEKEYDKFVTNVGERQDLRDLVSSEVKEKVDEAMKSTYLEEFYKINRTNLLEMSGFIPSSRNLLNSLVGKMSSDIGTPIPRKLKTAG